jgi:hypothetical protein
MESHVGCMMKQQTLAGFEKYGKFTRRAQFLAEMERVVPWAQLCAVIEPVYSKAGAEGGFGIRDSAPRSGCARQWCAPRSGGG